MKTMIMVGMGAAALLFGGCMSSTTKTASFTVPAEAVEMPPRKGDYRGAYAYARDRAQAGDYGAARRYYELAVQWLPAGGTEDREYERENLVSAAWMALMAGDRSEAVTLSDRAAGLETYAPASPRLAVLRVALRLDDPASLPASQRNAIGL